MKIDRAKLKKTMPTGGDSVPSELKSLVAKLKDGTEDQIIQLLTGFNEWTHKQTDLHHWIDVLDKFDSILASCATRSSESVYCLAVDLPANENMLSVLKLILNFTIILIKHSFSLHVYTSFDHLSSLLLSSNMEVVTLTLDLLIALYKRCSNYTSSPLDRKPPGLKARLSLLAENWGGKEHGVSLSQCAQEWGGKAPASVENFVFEFQRPLTISSSSTTVLGIIPGTNTIGATNLPSSGATVTTENVKIEVLKVYNRVKLGTTDLVKLNTDLAAHYRVPEESKEQFWFRLRLAANMGDLKQRQLCVQARLLAIGVNASSESSFQFSPQLVDEIMALLSLPGLYDLKGTALRTLRAFIAHDRHSKLKIMLDATGLNSYHGLLPNMVRSAINLLVNADNDPKAEKLPRKYTIPLFSFVFHFGYYEAGRTAMNQVYMIEHLRNTISATASLIFNQVVVGGGQEAIELTTGASESGKFESRFFHLIFEEEFARVKDYLSPVQVSKSSGEGEFSTKTMSPRKQLENRPNRTPPNSKDTSAAAAVSAKVAIPKKMKERKEGFFVYAIYGPEHRNVLTRHQSKRTVHCNRETDLIRLLKQKTAACFQGETEENLTVTRDCPRQVMTEFLDFTFQQVGVLHKEIFYVNPPGYEDTIPAPPRPVTPPPFHATITPIPSPREGQRQQGTAQQGTAQQEQVPNPQEGQQGQQQQNDNSYTNLQEELKKWIGYGADLMYTSTQLAPEKIITQEHLTFIQASADFTRELRSKTMYKGWSLSNWHIARDQKTVEGFIFHANELTRNLGIRYQQPIIINTFGDNYRGYLQAISKIEAFEMIVVVLSNNNKTLYDDIKKQLSFENGFPSHCVLVKTWSINTKIVIQMAVKVAAEQWTFYINVMPDDVMVVGFDVFRDKGKRRNPVGGFVSSLNPTVSSWFSKINFHVKTEEVSGRFANNLGAALRAYMRNDKYFTKIVVIRDGVSEGQYMFTIETVLEQRSRQTVQNVKIIRNREICVPIA